MVRLRVEGKERSKDDLQISNTCNWKDACVIPLRWSKVVEGRVDVVIPQKFSSGTGAIPLVEPYQIRKADKKWFEAHILTLTSFILRRVS